MSRICFLLVTVLALILSVPAAYKLSFSLYHSEVNALDRQFVLRPGTEPFAQDHKVILIGIDAQTFEAQAKPTVFWIGDIGKVTQALLDGGASAVGLDLLVGEVGTEGGLQEPKYDPVVNVMLDEETELLTPLLTTHRVLLGQYQVPGTNVVVPDTNRKRTQNALASTAASEGLLCLINIQTDNDGVIRATAFSYRKGDEIPGAYTFGFRLVELATGKTFQLQDGVLKLGDEVIPTEPDGTARVVRLNFPGVPGPIGTAFPYVSFGELLDRVKAGKPLEGFKDAVCIICYQDPAEQDYRTTPYRLTTGLDGMGAEAHATLVNQILTGRYIRKTGPLVWIGLTLALSLLVAYAAYNLRWYYSLPIGLLILAGYAFGTQLAFRQGTWVPVVTPLMAATGAYFITYLSRYDLVKRLFGSMVGAQVMHRMLKETDVRLLGGEERRVTVLFSDINDFTPMTERNTPERVILMLNEYFSEMCNIVDRYEGNIKQFVGDEIMVIFNAPQNQPDHAARAVRCAMDMIDRLAELKAASGGKDGFYEVKIGINTGDCVAGSVGSARRMEYAAVGDDVNLGARIESLTKKLGAFLLVSAATKQECQDQLPEVEWISRGVQQFKGKSAQMEVFEVRRK